MPEQTIFFICAILAGLTAFAVVFSRNTVYSALSLLVNFCLLAVLYILLNAQFLAAAQILVYAGAIAVLFLFVVMLLGEKMGEIVPTWLTVRNAVIVALGLIFVTFVGTAVYDNYAQGKPGDMTPELIAKIGQTELLASALFTRFLLPFEIASVLLLIGMIGVVVLAQSRRMQFGEESEDEQ
jgi:NADH-quinone oxidoreductase subunit J